MTSLRYMTAGESHGKGGLAFIEGLPAGVPVTLEKLNRQLQRRQQGYGRGGRMRIEKDEVEILSGVRFGQSIGAPIALWIKNRDWENWQTEMSAVPVPEFDSEKK